MEENAAFAETFDCPFRLLCDTDKSIAIAYGAADDASTGWPNRHTYVIGPDGHITAAFDTEDPGGQATQLLEHL